MVRREDAPHPLDARGLAAEVELGLQRLRQVLDDRGGIDDLTQRGPGSTVLRGEHAEQAEVAGDLLTCARTLHLHHDALAGRQRRAVHLRDRTGGERLGLDALEHVVPRDAQLLLHHLDDLRLGERRHLVAQRGELVDVLRRHEVGTGGEHLPELAEGRAELLERLAELARGLAGLGAVVVALAPGEQLGDPVLRDDARDLGRPPAEQQLSSSSSSTSTTGCGSCRRAPTCSP